MDVNLTSEGKTKLELGAKLSFSYEVNWKVSPLFCPKTIPFPQANADIPFLSSFNLPYFSRHQTGDQHQFRGSIREFSHCRIFPAGTDSRFCILSLLFLVPADRTSIWMHPSFRLVCCVRSFDDSDFADVCPNGYFGYHYTASDPLVLHLQLFHDGHLFDRSGQHGQLLFPSCDS